MKLIRSINDIIEINSDYPFHFMEHLKQEFMVFYDALCDGEKLFDFQVPNEFAFGVLQKDDVVKELCDSPFDLEYVEKFHVEQVTFYRIGIRSNDEIAVYYSLKGLHSHEDEEWLEEQSEWNKH